MKDPSPAPGSVRLKRAEHITGAERARIAAALRNRYARGASIRDLAVETGRSYGWTHRVLRESGAVLRGRGGDHSARRRGLEENR